MFTTVFNGISHASTICHLMRFVPLVQLQIAGESQTKQQPSVSSARWLRVSWVGSGWVNHFFRSVEIRKYTQILECLMADEYVDDWGYERMEILDGNTHMPLTSSILSWLIINFHVRTATLGYEDARRLKSWYVYCFKASFWSGSSLAKSLENPDVCLGLQCSSLFI